MPVIVEAVPGAIEQILDNLLDNALNAAPAGTTISLTVTTGTDEHQLDIVDEGPGLDDHQKVRDPPILARRGIQRRDWARTGHRRRPR